MSWVSWRDRGAEFNATGFPTGHGTRTDRIQTKYIGDPDAVTTACFRIFRRIDQPFEPIFGWGRSCH